MMWGRPLANEFSYHATQSRAHFLHSFHERVDSVLQLIFGELHSTAEPAVSALLGRLPITTSQPNRLFLNGLGWGPCPPRKTKFPPHMVAQGSGRIIQIGSISGQRGNMGGMAYGASKAAVMHVCKVMAVELSGAGVMVNAIAPGPIETGISSHGPTRKQGYIDRIPVGSYGTVGSVANAALFLASDECEWITGHVLNVDGGYGGAGLSYDSAEITGNG